MHLNQNLKANLKTSKDWIISFDVFVMYSVIGDVSTDDKGFSLIKDNFLHISPLHSWKQNIRLNL